MCGTRVSPILSSLSDPADGSILTCASTQNFYVSFARTSLAKECDMAMPNFKIQFKHVPRRWRVDKLGEPGKPPSPPCRLTDLSLACDVCFAECLERAEFHSPIVGKSLMVLFGLDILSSFCCFSYYITLNLFTIQICIP